MAKNIEIEIQVQVENAKPFISFLKKSAKEVFSARQIDEYFIPKHRDFLASKPVSEWLRLRCMDNSYSINYKYWHYDKNGKSSNYCDEYETKVESIDSLKMILQSLDFKPIVKVDKKRTSYLFENYEISIDSVAELGDFIEIEYKGKSGGDKAKEITDEMIQFLKSFNVGKIYKNYVGYPFQLLYPEDFKLEEL